MATDANIKSLRSAAGLSQDDVAAALGLTRPAYNGIETGVRQPSLEILARISELFGVRIESIISNETFVSPGEYTDGSDQLDRLKYKSVVLYLAEKIGAWPNVGETVFYKLLYFIETRSLYTGKGSIIGEVFLKRQYGPVPANFKEITEEMISENALDKVTGRYFTFMQTKYLPRISSTALTDNEKAIIDEVVAVLGNKTATELSDLSHLDKPWIDGQDGRPVDMELIWNTDRTYLVQMGRV